MLQGLEHQITRIREREPDGTEVGYSLVGSEGPLMRLIMTFFELLAKVKQEISQGFKGDS